ncbi:sensor histidine kinase [Sporomusa acidovorans]|uniref:histidine kinase n=1 Tax=Sporomusa acidovorans (strain ATCC 49682 / DSM 3132 / Mol) TaxID=1123286 RepID=A0ABZ3IZU9_SPOA4|nr:HAMP domain-containing sensor histidine kinase [Sporomusa acidovorans]OZC22294.1 sensor protein kinase WalK [Sporomusa acidovorans DSM 3132]SDF36045.1 His Kinase A (phospho-acceptor) domain-containing protein [Sporomusa acidovorans]
MFSKIRNHLTMVYSAVMACFLISFIVASYTGLVWVLYREEQRDIEAFAKEEAHEHVNLLRQRKLSPNSPVEEDEDQSDGKLFHYAFDVNGRQISSSQPAREVRDAITEHIHNWQDGDGEAVLTKLHLAGDKKGYFMLCKIMVYEGEDVLGTVFVGKDITTYYVMLKRILFMLCVVCLFFLIIATFAGHMLAGRTIVPIRNSFLRQREFVADASHELRTPLSVMLTSVDVIRTDDDNKLSSFSQEVLDDMKEEIRRMTKIVSDLLTLARADAGAANIIKEKFDISLVAGKVIRSLLPIAAEKGIKLEFAGADSLIVQADKERMNQLLLILLDNAIKYGQQEGSVILTVKQAGGSKGTVNLIVQDDGAGIPQEQQQLIFERFYRVDKVRSREAGGNGLGLAIAKWIVEAHGGTIRVESTIGVGSTFIVTLPGVECREKRL